MIQQPRLDATETLADDALRACLQDGETTLESAIYEAKNMGGTKADFMEGLDSLLDRGIWEEHKLATFRMVR